MIELWPAIDLINNQSVRLTEGDYDTKELMPRTPQEAIVFYNQFEQVKRIHIVDLMGALHQKPAEEAFIKELIQVSEHPIEIGGAFALKILLIIISRAEPLMLSLERVVFRTSTG